MKTESQSCYMSGEGMITYIKDRLRSPTSKVTLPQTDNHHQTDGPSPEPSCPRTPVTEKKHIGQSIVEFWTGVTCPPDSLNTYILVTARMLRYEVNHDEAIKVLERYCHEHPDPSFSTRLCSGDDVEVARVIRNTVRIVFDGNGGQRDPETSTRILNKAHAFFQKVGFKVSDKATWDNLSNPAPRLGADFQWSEDEIQLIQQHLVPVLKTDLETAQAATKHFVRFVLAHENQEISRDSLPTILREFSLNIRKSSKKSRFLQELINLGWLSISRHHQWQPRGSGLVGTARHYVVGPNLSHKVRVSHTNGGNHGG